MPKLKAKNSGYPAMKKRLQALGLWKGPKFTKDNKPRPSIPMLFPEIKGSAASRYQRKTEGGTAPIRGHPKITYEFQQGPYDRFMGDFRKVKVEVGRQKGEIVGFKTLKPILRKISKKGGGGALKNLNKPKQVKHYRLPKPVARPGGTRGARPQREQRKQAKK